MGGRRFTRMNKFGTRLCKLDRILVSQRFVSAWPNAILTALPPSKNDLKIRDLKHKVKILDVKAENGCLDIFDIDNWVSFMKEIEDLEHLKNLDLMQKAKIKWAIEGDENSKFIHGYINNKISRSRINVLTNRLQFTSNLFKTFSNHDITFLGALFSISKIKEAVWNCGGSKALGPDSFTFNFIKHYWDILGKDFIDMVKKFEMHGYIPRGCNSSFIALVPKIQDPLNIKDYRPISLTGCQYKVIAKVLANRLQQVVHSVVSDVQTAYLKGRQITDGPLMIQKGLRQGDPLSPFLFIIAMEALHVAFEEAKSKLIFEGVKVGANKVNISHLQFADDSLIMDMRRNIRDGVEKSQLDDMLLLLRDFSLVDTPDSWQYTLDDSNTFSVNIHSWRLRMDRLPSRYNIDLRGIDLNSVRCPLCDGDIETSQHLFVDCPVACDVWKFISSWWGLKSYPNNLSSLLS
ncbi:RNA-directed DNA polymerase, eukaryota [Tanacetum coccineum]|uniref:RNA-directed DNA polymerase, eukaryota n=1 Tax=Tanacetum coccineum TaxID=301880 RepID=A0ABQ5H7V0_9ASTR